MSSVGVAIALGAIAVEIAGATVFRERWWGAHAWGFLPRAWFFAASLVVVALLAAAWRAPAALDRLLVRTLGPLTSASGGIARAFAAALAGVVFWLAREGHTLLGDGNALAANIAAGQSFHPDEPLTLWLHRLLFDAVGPLFAARGLAPADVARATIALSSVVSGALFVPIAWSISGSLVPAGAAPSSTGRGGVRTTQALVFAVLVAQGYVQVFFGHVENYTYLTLALAAYALAAVRAMEGRAPLLLPAALLALALGLHLSAAAVLPSFAVLAAWRLLDSKARMGAVRDLALSVVAGAGLQVLLARLSPGYDWLGEIITVGGRAYVPPVPGQFIQQQLLVGPLALLLLGAAVIGALSGGSWRGGRVLFLGALLPGCLAAVLLAGDSNLGQARNWDLLAPITFVLTFVALAIATRPEWTEAGLRRWLFVLALASLFHTVPWIAVNASAERTIERFKALPLGLGRSQVLVADWYDARGREDEALEWYRRALDENPLQNHAHSQLGRIALHRGRYDIAAMAFREALRSRPTMALYRFQLVDALVRAHELPAARAELDTLLALQPAVAGYRAASAVLWLGLGEQDSAAAALGAAERLAPGDSLAPLLRGAIARGVPAAEVVREVWPRIVQY